METNHEATAEALQFFEQDIQEPMQIIRQKYFPGIVKDDEKRIEYWRWYDKLSESILTEVEDEKIVRNFLKDYTVLEGSLLQTAAMNEFVSMKNMKLVIQKFMEELVITACVCESDELLISLLEKDGSLANLKRFSGEYVLHWAMQYASENIIDALLRYGAVPEVEDSEGKNALHYAAVNSDEVVWLKYSGDSRFKKLLKRCDNFGEFPHKN